MKSRKLTTVQEFDLGTEDRVFLARMLDGIEKWYWQARGSDDCYGPFETREDAIRDYTNADA